MACDGLFSLPSAQQRRFSGLRTAVLFIMSLSRRHRTFRYLTEKEEFNMKKITLTLFAFIFSSMIVMAEESTIPVIIDTDLGMDDARAFSLFLSSNKVSIKAIVTSDGASSPRAGYENILRIYKYLKKPFVPVGVGRTFGAPPWREKCDSLGWAIWPDNMQNNPGVPDSTDVLTKTLNEINSPAIYICMGPLTNIAGALKNENFPKRHIDKILYYGTSPNDPELSWNTRRDLESARFVFSSSLPIWVIHPSPDQLIAFNAEFYNTINSINTDTARLIVLTHKDKRVQRLFGTKHSMVWDEVLALYTYQPSLITLEQLQHDNPVYRFKSWNKDQAKRLYFDILRQRIDE